MNRALFACSACGSPLRLFVRHPLGLPGLHGYCGRCVLVLVQFSEPLPATTTDSSTNPTAAGDHEPTGRHP